MALARALRLPGGGWRAFAVVTPDGRRATLHVGADKAPRQIRREMHTKRLLNILAQDWGHPADEP
eukprot:791902-Pyramimonas_sp.AAC.1